MIVRLVTKDHVKGKNYNTEYVLTVGWPSLALSNATNSIITLKFIDKSKRNVRGYGKINANKAISNNKTLGQSDDSFSSYPQAQQEGGAINVSPSVHSMFG